MKRSSWIDSLISGVSGDALPTPAAREDVARIDEILFEEWNLGENVILAWTKERAMLSFLAVRHYRILEPFGGEGQGEGRAAHEFITGILAGSKFVPPAEFERLHAALGDHAHLVTANLRSEHELREELGIISALVTRYGVTLVRDRAVLLFDVVGFSLHSPLEQVAMLNSLSFSLNTAYSQLVSEDIKPNFARSTTGDGFYLWNRSRTIDANIALFKLMMLVLADNAIARRKAGRFPVPKLRAAFHVGEHFEFYQVEALNPTTYSYIVGEVTIELARIIDRALPGQIVLGEFEIALTDPRTGRIANLTTRDFVERTASVLDQLSGLTVSEERVSEIRCYLTGNVEPEGGHSIERFSVHDKHGIAHPAYNAKINIHLRDAQPLFLGVQQSVLRNPDSTWPA